MNPTDKAAIEGLIKILQANPFKLDANREVGDAAVPALQRLLAGETRETDKPAGVLRAQLESDIEKMRGDYVTSGSFGSLYDAGWSAACKYWANRLSALIKSTEDPHHG